MTDRAKRLEKFLRVDLGWETEPSAESRCGCGNKTYTIQKFCELCGGEMRQIIVGGSTIDELERAIKYALKEKA